MVPLTSDDRALIDIEMDTSVNFAAEALDFASAELGQRIRALIGTPEVVAAPEQMALPKTSWQFVVVGLERGAAACRELGSSEPHIQPDDDEYLATAGAMERLIQRITRALD